MSTSLKSLISWGRYLHWAHLSWESMSSVQEIAGDQMDARSESLMLAHIASWASSLFSVLEGWRELKLTDPIIDLLIDRYPEYCDALRRYRNAVSHFQKELFDQRIVDFTTRYSIGVLWAGTLHFEFQRYLWQWPDLTRGTDEEKDLLRDAFRDAIGWFPINIIAAQMYTLKRVSREAQLLLESSGDRSSPEARELLEAIELANSLVSSTDISPLVAELFKHPRSRQ